MARDVDAALPLLSHHLRSSSQILSFSNLRELDEHRQVYSGNDFDFFVIEECRCDICRCPTKHVCQNQNAVRRLDALQSLLDHPCGRLNIIVPSNGDGRDVMNFPNDHLRRIEQFDCKPAMSDDQSADHFYDWLRPFLKLLAVALALRVGLTFAPLMLRYYPFSTSRCETLTPYCCSLMCSARAFAIKTDRCRPPVQP